MVTDLAWVDDIDLEPGSPWLRMGTRALGDRPWLVADAKAVIELALRRQLMTERPGDVLAEPDSAKAAAGELEALVAGAADLDTSVDSSLQRIGRSVQEDFCLLERGADEWILRSAVLCFPSRWRLAQKLDRPLLQVHQPVPGYADDLGGRVTKLIDGLADRIVLRRNWFIHPDPSLFQPDRPVAGDPVIPATSVGTGLFLRSERQTLRLLPETGWCVFAIRTQRCTLDELMGVRGPDLWAWLEGSSPEDVGHRGISTEQATELRLVGQTDS